MKGKKTFQHCFLYTASADNKKNFLKYSQSNTHHLELICTFPIFSGLKPNLTKYEIAEVGALKGVRLAVCRIDQRNEVIKILGTYVSYNNGIKVASNFLKVGSNVQTVLNLWHF